MTILLGNSGSPRWYAGSDRRFTDYLRHLTNWGATSAEVVLHHGPFDIRTARVHIMERDWQRLIDRYQAARLAVQFHVSLDARFASQRWLNEAHDLRDQYRPTLELIRSVAVKQEQTVLVLHGASGASLSLADNDRASLGLLGWLAEEFESMPGGAVAAIELGAYNPSRQGASARSRTDILRLVEAVDSERVGICWDLAHDFQNSTHEPGWAVVPDERFLARVVHVHLHDVDENGVAHYPLVLGNVPFPAQIAALSKARTLPPLTMELRWRCARRLGVPWEMLEKSYAAVLAVLDEIGAK